MAHHDHSLDTLLDLHGATVALDAGGCWAKFNVMVVMANESRPHGLSYSLTMHDPDGQRLVGFDNAHQVKGGRRSSERAFDHLHRLDRVTPYEYVDAGTLVTDFWTVVASVMRQRGNQT